MARRVLRTLGWTLVAASVLSTGIVIASGPPLVRTALKEVLASQRSIWPSVPNARGPIVTAAPTAVPCNDPGAVGRRFARVEREFLLRRREKVRTREPYCGPLQSTVAGGITTVGKRRPSQR